MMLSSDLVIYLFIELVIACCAMRHPFLTFFQRHNVFHQSYFLMKVAHIKFFIINKFKKNAKLGCGKLARKQVEYDRGIELYHLANGTNASLIIRLWSKANVLTSFNATQQAW